MAPRAPAPVPRSPEAVAEGLDEAMIREVVHHFYAAAREDPVIGPVFRARVPDDRWQAHLVGHETKPARSRYIQRVRQSGLVPVEQRRPVPIRSRLGGRATSAIHPLTLAERCTGVALSPDTSLPSPWSTHNRHTDAPKWLDAPRTSQRCRGRAPTAGR